MIDRKATAEADTNSSGVVPDAAAVDEPSVEPEPTPVAVAEAEQLAPADAAELPAAAPTPDDSEKKRRSRLAEVRPSPLVTLAVLGVLAALSIIGGLVFGGDTALGKACVVGFIPAFSIAIGIVATHWYSRRNLNAQLASLVQNAMYTTLHLKRSVRYVDDRLGSAIEHLENGRAVNALLEVVRAKTATELSFGTAQQSSRQWESISESGARAAHLLFVADDDELRPRIIPGNNPKTVATSESAMPSGDDKDE